MTSEEMLDQALAIEMVDFQAFCSVSLREEHLLAGRLKEAHAAAERALAPAHEHQERGHQAYALRLLGDIAAHRGPRRPSRARPTTARPSPWPTNSACARCRHTATVASAPYMAGRDRGSRPAMSYLRLSRCTVPWA